MVNKMVVATKSASRPAVDISINFVISLIFFFSDEEHLYKQESHL